MNVSKLLAAAPWVRRAWRIVPGPLRIPLLVIAAIVWFIRGRDDGQEA